jgi:hypothetical protein
MRVDFVLHERQCDIADDEVQRAFPERAAPRRRHIAERSVMQ